MKTNSTVKTEERAKEIISSYVNENNLTNGYFKNASCRCECGETLCVTWYNFEVSLRVAICEACGNDDAFIDEVLTIY